MLSLTFATNLRLLRLVFQNGTAIHCRYKGCSEYLSIKFAKINVLRDVSKFNSMETNSS